MNRFISPSASRGEVDGLLQELIMDEDSLIATPGGASTVADGPLMPFDIEPGPTPDYRQEEWPQPNPDLYVHPLICPVSGDE